MISRNSLETRLIDKVKKLSLEQIQEVERFIDSFNLEKAEPTLTRSSNQLSESVFKRIWDNSEDAVYDDL